MSEQDSSPGAEQSDWGRDVDTDSPLPAKVAGYQIIARLGGGSMADLYLANKVTSFGFVRRVVIKRVKRSRADYKALESMLLDEARATALFDHPNLISLLDVGGDKQSAFLALEYVDGTDLRRVNAKLRQRREALPFELACFIVAEVLRGLHHAHTAVDDDGNPLDIVHRDVNPANVLVSRSGHVKLADFGVVRMRNRIQQKTQPGLVKGKYAYLAPEYIAGENCNVQTDIYAAGIMLFELLTGRECFTGKTAYEVMWKIVNQGVPTHRLEREGVPEDLQRIVLKATSTAPEHRYQTCQDMANSIEAWLMRSGSHATPWVVSVFFNRHELYPAALEELDPVEAIEVLPAEVPDAAISNPAPTPTPRVELEKTPFDADAETPAPARQVAPSASEVDVQLDPSAPILAPIPGLDELTVPTPLPSIEIVSEGLVSSVQPTEQDSPLEVEARTVTPPREEAPVAKSAATFEPEITKPIRPMDDAPTEPPHDVIVTDPPEATPPAAEAATEIPEREETAPEVSDELPAYVSAAETVIEPTNEPLDFPTSGKLEDIPAVEVLDTITSRGLSGILEFRCGLIWKRVQLQRGTPIGITSNMGMELIGEHMVKARHITRRELDKALQHGERTGTLLIVTLMELGLAEREVLETELGRNLEARLKEVLEWRWGTFEFRQEKIITIDLQPKLDLGELMSHARATRERQAEEVKPPPQPESNGDGSPDDPQSRLKEALRVAKSIASSSGKGRVETPWRSSEN